MADEVKVFIGELNGEDLPFKKEYLLKAENVPTNTIDETVQDKLDELSVPYKEREIITVTDPFNMLNDWLLADDLSTEETNIVVDRSYQVEKIVVSNIRDNCQFRLTCYQELRPNDSIITTLSDVAWFYDIDIPNNTNTITIDGDDGDLLTADYAYALRAAKQSGRTARNTLFKIYLREV